MVESKLGPPSTSVISDLLYLPRVILRIENLFEWGLAGETKVLGECPPQIPLDQTRGRTRAVFTSVDFYFDIANIIDAYLIWDRANHLTVFKTCVADEYSLL
jgi:hypothetical protein